MELKTNAFRARFAPEANNFVSLVNLATGDDYIKAAPRGPLVELYALADGEAVRRLQDSFPLQMQALHEAHHMRPRLMDFFLGAQKLILEQRKKSGSVICDQALSIIEERYMDPDLSLVVISSEIAVSPNYLSALIKKSTGSTFIDLLTRRRIETAKELVIGTSMKVKEISERCGYNDQHYFSYCFKKYTGLSPGACRRQYEEQQS